MKISKKHKMYIRNSHSELRNLMNLKPSLFFIIYHEFNVGDAIKRYELLNAQANHWTHFRPIDFKLNEIQSKELYEISAIGKETVFYNGGWQPLVNLIAFDYEEKAEIPLEKIAEKKTYYKTTIIPGIGKERALYLFGKCVFLLQLSVKKGHFRLFGLGIKWVHKSFEVNFSERIGKKKSLTIGNYRFGFLK
jgi:hypothetical protein